MYLDGAQDSYQRNNLLPISQFVTDILIPLNPISLYTIILKMIIYKKKAYIIKQKARLYTTT